MCGFCPHNTFNPFGDIYMTENVNASCSASAQKKCAPVCLLLFVGFIFGFSAGFVSHDAIYKTLSRAMYGSKQLVSEPIPGRDHSVRKASETATETPDGEEEKMDQEETTME